MALAKRLPAALFASAAVLALSPGVLGHGNDTAMDMGMGMGMEEETDFDRPMPEDAYPPTYFSHSEYQAAIYTHISIMVVAWVFVLPIGKLRPASTASPFPGVLTLGLAVMLSLARSRYTLAFQFVFVAMNAVGVLVGGIYNANTPDLYPNNAHHKLGWIVTWMVLVQVLIGLLSRFADALRNKSSGPHRYTEQQSFIPVSTQALAEHGRLGESRYPKFSRLSNDSGQGTEPNTDSLRSHSPPTSPSSVSIPLHDTAKEYDQDEDDDLEAHIPSPRSHGRAQALARKLASKLSSRAWKALMLVYGFVDRTILILAFITLSTGVISFGRFFVRSLPTPHAPRYHCFVAQANLELLLLGGTRNFQRSGALDQGRHLCLARHPHLGPLGRMFWRARMGKFFIVWRGESTGLIDLFFFFFRRGIFGQDDEGIDGKNGFPQPSLPRARSSLVTALPISSLSTSAAGVVLGQHRILSIRR